MPTTPPRAQPRALPRCRLPLAAAQSPPHPRHPASTMSLLRPSCTATTRAPLLYISTHLSSRQGYSTPFPFTTTTSRRRRRRRLVVSSTGCSPVRTRVAKRPTKIAFAFPYHLRPTSSFCITSHHEMNSISTDMI
jgi:hypothetical protein